MRLLTKKAFLVLMLLGFVSQGLWAAQSQATGLPCCDPAMNAATHMNQSSISEADAMNDMPCHDQEQSCESSCQEALHLSSGMLASVSSFTPIGMSSHDPIHASQLLVGISLDSIAHPPNA